MAISDRALAQLRTRRLIAQLAGRKLRSRPTRVPVQRWPRAARASYYFDLRSMIADLRDVAVRELLPALSRLLSSTPSQLRRDAAGDLQAELEALLRLIEAAVPDERVRRAAREAAQKAAAFNKIEVSRQFESALGFDLLQHEPDIAEQIDLFTLDNVRLIGGMTDDLEHQIKGLVMNAARSGTLVEDLSDQILQRFEVAQSRADLIARDQIGKFNGELTRLRQTSAGVEEYDWITSRDERVREGHRLLDGTRQKWSEPPIEDPRRGTRGHPGEPINCRCAASPVLTDLAAKLAG